MADAARTWLDMLDPEQRAIGQGSVPVDDASDGERRRWFYTPTDHGGLTVHQQRPAQHRAAMRLVATGLSAGRVRDCRDDHGSGERARLQRGVRGPLRPGTRPRPRNVLLCGCSANREATGAWGWRFGGHHVSLNNLVVDGVLVSTTPCFLGADPAVVAAPGGSVQPPARPGRGPGTGPDAVAAGRASLSRALLLDRAPSDFVTANRTSLSDGDRLIPLAGIWRNQRFADALEQEKLQALSDAIDPQPQDYTDADHLALAYTTTPKGVAAADLDAGQRELLRALLETYLGRAPVGVSPWNHYGDESVLDEVHFLWAGPTEAGAPHYYRLQAPRLLIEWDNTQRNANHAHSVWRDPTSDFGLDVLARHHAAHHA